MKILIVNGPNLGLLGTREPEIYGRTTLAMMMDDAVQYGKTLGAEIDWMQSDIEGDIVHTIVKAKDVYDGIVINPAAYTHTSVAIHDAIKGVALPIVEVHISNIYQREGYRHESMTASACVGQICGFGAQGYKLAVLAIVNAKKEA